jgi:hypothetical protein
LRRGVTQYVLRVQASGRPPCHHFPWHPRRQRRKEKEKKKKKSKKGKKERKSKKRKREKAPVERSIITGKRIQRKEGGVADQAGEAVLASQHIATLSTRGAYGAHAVDCRCGFGALRV